ncbi:unnamed protein product [Adineta steineri]|uniref:Uncharacterized protein n=1 Tax=Adineta steineri TaxID=433720 RepID=A0A815SWQ4_9BILA|nr:unnamed protein product [Adineta steineri]CAF4012256.1 unnamed protein product [Adineta steineri]
MLLPAHGSQIRTNTGVPTNIAFLLQLLVIQAEKYIGIKPEESRINCSDTVNLLQSFGLYKQDGAVYDCSIMFTLYNSFTIVKRSG